MVAYQSRASSNLFSDDTVATALRSMDHVALVEFIMSESMLGHMTSRAHWAGGRAGGQGDLATSNHCTKKKNSTY